MMNWTQYMRGFPLSLLFEIEIWIDLFFSKEHGNENLTEKVGHFIWKKVGHFI